jgi:GntR family transcriptional regulator
MKIDPASVTPVYEQIAAQIRGGIVSGLFRPGELIPSIRELALDLLVNPNTVKRAYEQLEREGLVTPRRGLGMEVRPSTLVPAKARASEVVESAMSDALRLAKRHAMTRADVDAIFERSWSREFGRGSGGSGGGGGGGSGGSGGGGGRRGGERDKHAGPSRESHA